MEGSFSGVEIKLSPSHLYKIRRIFIIYRYVIIMMIIIIIIIIIKLTPWLMEPGGSMPHS